MSKTERKIVSSTNISINIDKIPKEKIIKGEKGRYVNIVIWNFDGDDEYGKNSTAIVSQTEGEQKDAGTPTIYLGNGLYNIKKEEKKIEEEEEDIF